MSDTGTEHSAEYSATADTYVAAVALVVEEFKDRSGERDYNFEELDLRVVVIYEINTGIQYRAGRW